jgi:hypothetical protein
MSKLLALAAALLCAFATLDHAQAQAFRTWVSSGADGDDINPCNRLQPCRTFPTAMSNTAAGGEINVLSPGSYGVITINKSLSIIAEGVTAGILAPSVNGIRVAAGAGDVVIIKGLDINGLGTGLEGIRIERAKSVHISKSIIHGFSAASSSAIAIVPSLSPVDVVISDTTITKNRQGILAAPTGGMTATVVADRVLAENTGGPAIRANANGTIRVTNSVISNNTRGLLQGGSGQIISAGNNFLVGNNIDGTFNSTVPLQ